MTQFGASLHRYSVLGSTNDEAHKWATEGAPHGAVVVAEEQTQGRGRQGRDWCSPAGLGLYLSLILRPQIALSQVPQLTMLAALGAARAVEIATGFPSHVKWPNDIILRGGKIGGILSEARAQDEDTARVAFAIVGIGLNVNFARDDLPRDAKIAATSLYIETGQVRPLGEFMSTLLRENEAVYASYEAGLWHELREEFARRDILHGRHVSVEAASETYEGEACGIAENGALLVRTRDGEKQILAGDVLLKLV